MPSSRRLFHAMAHHPAEQDLMLKEQQTHRAKPYTPEQSKAGMKLSSQAPPSCQK